MSEQKIVVPNGMLQAAVAQAFETGKILKRRLWAEFFSGKDNNSVKLAKTMLAAALRWQDEELEKMIQDDPYLNDPFLRTETLNENAVRAGFNKALAAVRRMFNEQDSEVDPLVMYIMRHFDDIEGDVRALRCRADVAVKDFHEHQKRNSDMTGEPVSSERYPPPLLTEIKDLLLPDIESGFFKPEILNERILEAFRRGQKAGVK